MIQVSVIMATWNNCRRLAVTLDALGRCAVPPEMDWELVLVANNCTDETATTALRFADRLPLVYVEEPRQGLSHARNRGIATARGELFVFTDDDVRPCEAWLAHYWRAHRAHGGCRFLGGPLRSEFEGGAPPDEALLRVAHISIVGFDLGPAPRALESHEHFLGANWACPAAPLRAVGGYDLRLGLDASLGRRRVGEEFELQVRLRAAGLTPLYLPEAHVWHFVPRAKCTLRHIGDNARALGMYSVVSRKVSYMVEQRPALKRWCASNPWTLGGLLRTCAGTVLFALQWAGGRLTGGRDHTAYLGLQICLGRLSGYLEWLRGTLIERARMLFRRSSTVAAFGRQPPVAARDRSRLFVLA
jgi:glycosyltransferase involved in cell wall biosynthesis